VLLPYVAVVLANAGSAPDVGGPEPFGVDPERHAIEAGPDTWHG
jgi:hypothetical protein